jgi:lipopolysaccharide transport system permease protein
MSTDIALEAPAACDSEAKPCELPTTVIQPRSGWRALDLKELWRYRELLYFFVWRDVKVRYKQTLLGAAWAIIQPLMMTIIFTVVLGRMAKVSSGGFPYPIFVYAGLLPWTFFATAIANAGNSVVGEQHMITKIYFPRLAVPFAAVGAALVDFLIAFGVLVGMLLWYGLRPAWAILLVPVLLALMTLAALGVGTLLAALNVAYRDFRYVIPFLVQLWMFATPTVYMQPTDWEEFGLPQAAAQSDSRPRSSSAKSISHRTDSSPRPSPATGKAAGAQNSGRAAQPGPEGVVPDWIQKLLNLNPMTGVIGFFRAATLGGPLPWQKLGASTLIIVVVFAAGCYYFRRVEDSFADII